MKCLLDCLNNYHFIWSFQLNLLKSRDQTLFCHSHCLSSLNLALFLFLIVISVSWESECKLTWPQPLSLLRALRTDCLPPRWWQTIVTLPLFATHSRHSLGLPKCPSCDKQPPPAPGTRTWQHGNMAVWQYQHYSVQLLTINGCLGICRQIIISAWWPCHGH